MFAGIAYEDFVPIKYESTVNWSSVLPPLLSTSVLFATFAYGTYMLSARMGKGNATV